MTAMAVTGIGALSSHGNAVAEISAAVAGRADTATDVGAMYDQMLPVGRAHAMVEFDIRKELGRKGTGFFDRRTALTVVACGRALEDAGINMEEMDAARVGVVLGTTAGSIASSADYASETFANDLPYMVNPGLFPNTVMNCAAGQTAIWYGIHGVNATLAGGPTAMHSVLQYCENLFRGSKADVLLAGAVEEFTPHSAWTSWLNQSTGQELPGEGGAVLALRPRESLPSGAQCYAVVLGVALGFSPSNQDAHAAVARCVQRALDQAGEDPSEVRMAALGGGADEVSSRSMWRAVCEVVGQRAEAPLERLRVDPALGDCDSAIGTLELAAIIGRHQQNPELDGRLSVLTARTREGAVGAAVVRGWRSDADSR